MRVLWWRTLSALLYPFDWATAKAVWFVLPRLHRAERAAAGRDDGEEG